jgi:hypothetical protein
MDQWDLLLMIWVECILTWMMQVHIMDQDLKDLKDLLQERIWTVMEWLLHLHLMIQLTMWSKD